MGKIGLLLIGHGSRLKDNMQQVTDVAEMMREKRPDYLIRHCFLEYGYPTIGDGLSFMKQEDMDMLLIVPLLLTSGIHYSRDIPQILGLEAGTKTGQISLANGRTIPFAYAEPIGVDTLLVDLLLKHADAAKNLL